MHRVAKSFAATSIPQRIANEAGAGEQELHKIELLMSRVGIYAAILPARKACLEKEEATGGPPGAIELPNGTIVIPARLGNLMGCASSLLMNALKALAGIDDDLLVIDDEVIAPICQLENRAFKEHQPTSAFRRNSAGAGGKLPQQCHRRTTHGFDRQAEGMRCSFLGYYFANR